MRFFLKGIVYLLVLLVFAGCRKPTGANWDVDIVVPVASSKLNIKNFISDTIFGADNTGLLHFRINREIASLKLDSLIDLPSTDLNKEFPFPGGLELQPGQTFTFLPSSELTFSVDNGIELTRADIRKGTLTVYFSNSLPQPVDFIYVVTSAEKGGAPLTISEVIPPGNKSLIKTYDLSGYSFNMRGMGNHKVNTIIQTYTVGLNASASSVVATAGSSAKIDLSYSQLVPDYVEGYFGKQVIEVPTDTAVFNFFNNIQTSNFLLSETNMEFLIANEIGVDFLGNFNKITSYNSRRNKTVVLNSNKLSNLEFIGAKKAPNTFIAETQTVNFNSTNSNIAEFISNLPDKISFQGSITVNPLGNIFGPTDFAYYNAGIRVHANIDLPLKFTADQFRLESNTKTEIGNIEQLDRVNSGNFVVSANNGYPFTTRLQAYMINEFGQVIDSLFIPGSNSIAAAKVNANNDVESATRSRLYIPINKLKIDNLKKCRSLKIISTFIMPPNPPEIKILDSYEFDIKIIAELSYNVGVSEG
jgi:hypothetical protein